uniref:Metallophosphoesterase 1 n=1 Tax=Geotrypetes seraphini TaxID=260995 RepID=A0A6P8PNN5_GEOSA|nr:metallophosphoesterase 1 isoform X3 [Geotrypetes seraphini]
MAAQAFKCGHSKRHRHKKRAVFLLKIVCFLVFVFVFCEFLIYYVVIAQCSWPVVGLAVQGDRKESPPVLKAMFLSDTHLLGEITGHWFDKLKREWQMERSFQSALWLLQPDVVFILGDVFDEGKWSSPEAWEDDVRRFHKMFRHPSHIELAVLVGNHDIGFHYETNLYKLRRFEKVFNFSSAKIISRKGIKLLLFSFVLVNSVALEGDGCLMCKTTEETLIHLSHTLNCSRKIDQKHLGKECSNVEQISASAPILLQLLWWLRPRLILSGHTHSACEVLHNRMVPEISVPSFSWRNRNNPSFIMASLTTTDFTLAKCFLPVEDTVNYLYLVAGVVLLVLTVAFCLAALFSFAQQINKFKHI